jgi:mannose-1-phosphate guanylyltransferase
MNEAPSRHLWTIVLAGGEGVRLRQLTRALHGEDCPKQFAMISGGRSLLQSTVERALRWSTPERIVVVVAEEREELARQQLQRYRGLDIVAQPINRGTGPGILLPLARIMAFDPKAKVVVMPSDHYVRDDVPFERCIRLASAASDDQVALIGAVPDHAETQYGWIVPGRTLAAQRSSTVNQFCEKPPAALAERLYRSGALWNTFIMTGSARHFWSLGCEHLKAAVSLFELYQEAMNGPDEERVLREIYRYMPVSDFSREVLQKANGLRVVPLDECGWSDWGTPQRVLDSLRHHDDYAVLSRRLAMALLCA